MESYTLIRIYFKEGFNILQESEQVIKNEFLKIINEEIYNRQIHCAIVFKNDKEVIDSVFYNYGTITRNIVPGWVI
jgi:hypothetical protein